MLINDQETCPQRCPAPERLAAYALGKLSAEDVEAIASHISSCCDCESSLQHMDVEDNLVRNLRKYLGGQTKLVFPEQAGSSAEQGEWPPPVVPGYEILDR